jgi:hypothetical protein
VQSACIGLTAGGSADPATEVALSADVQRGGLAPYLQVWVERGSVPAGGSCAAFTGAQIWNGTLDRFPGTATAGIATGWRPAVAQRSVYRFTVTVLDDPRAEALRTSATFRWSLTEEGPPPADPTPEPVATPTPTAAPPSSTAAPSPSDPPGSTTADAPVPTAPPTSPPPAAPAPASPVPTASGGRTRVVEAPPLQAGPAAAVQAALAAAGQVAQQVGKTAVAVAHNGQFPLGLVGCVAGFLFLQGRLDRRDPKLALARVREELSEYRDFPEPPPTETT